jgi:hypothetical protein
MPSIGGLRGAMPVARPLRQSSPCDQVFGGDAFVQHQLDAGQLDLAAEVADGFVELFLARHLLGNVELAADFGRAVEQGDVMTALGGDGGEGQAGRTGADHGHALHLGRSDVVQFGFVAGARVDQAGGDCS